MNTTPSNKPGPFVMVGLMVSVAAVLSLATTQTLLRQDVRAAVRLGPQQDRAAFDQPSHVLVEGKDDGTHPAVDYIITPHRMLKDQKTQIDAYLKSEDFQARRASIKASRDKRGILVNAGGVKYLTNFITTLKVLREKLNCTLPVEIAWNNERGLDAATVKALNKKFGPVSALYLDAIPYPKHHRRPPTVFGFNAKVYSLLHTKFKEVLVLDSDVTPLMDPTLMFDDLRYKEASNLFFPDAWDDWVKDEAYTAAGLQPDKVKAILSAAKQSDRDTESGVMLIDRAVHADVLEYVWWINSYSDIFYDKLVYGDKDTFAMGFAQARKAHLFRQQNIPPGGVYHWAGGRAHIVWKDGSKPKEDGWELMGAIQYNIKGQAAFWHRTMGKFQSPHLKPVPVEMISGPLPTWWNRYYMALVPTGPTQCDRLEYCAPDWAVLKLPWQLPAADVTIQKRVDNKLQVENISIFSKPCHLAQVEHYLALVRLALPVTMPEDLMRVCDSELREALQVVDASEPVNGSRTDDAGQGHERKQDLAGLVEQTRMTYVGKEYMQGRVDDTLKDSKRVAMLMVTPDARSPQLDIIRATYGALAWLKEHAQQFPSLGS